MDRSKRANGASKKEKSSHLHANISWLASDGPTLDFNFIANFLPSIPLSALLSALLPLPYSLSMPPSLSLLQTRKLFMTHLLESSLYPAHVPTYLRSPSSTLSLSKVGTYSISFSLPLSGIFYTHYIALSTYILHPE